MPLLNGPDDHNRFEGLNGQGRVPGPIGKQLEFRPLTADEFRRQYKDRLQASMQNDAEELPVDDKTTDQSEA